jgi:hypothetical protein
MMIEEKILRTGDTDSPILNFGARGERFASRDGRFTDGEKAPGTH